MNIRIVEKFGPVWQGEGPSAGRLAAFVRLGGCNLSCAWCDTPYSWDATRFNLREEITSERIADIATWLKEVAVPLLCITGGEPLLQGEKVDGLAWVARELGMEVEVETNGTIMPIYGTTKIVARWNVSPKLTNAGMSTAKRIVPPVLAHYLRLPAVFKFVCRTEADLEEVDGLVTMMGIPAARVWIMPEGQDAAAVTTHARSIAAATLARHYNLTLRQHILLWGAERGR